MPNLSDFSAKPLSVLKRFWAKFSPATLLLLLAVTSCGLVAPNQCRAGAGEFSDEEVIRLVVRGLTHSPEWREAGYPPEPTPGYLASCCRVERLGMSSLYGIIFSQEQAKYKVTASLLHPSHGRTMRYESEIWIGECGSQIDARGMDYETRLHPLPGRR